MSITVHLVIRKNDVLCTRCMMTAPVNAGNGTPMSTLLAAYQMLAEKHQRCKLLKLETSPRRLLLGTKVRLLRDLRNGGGDSFLAGTVMELRDRWKGRFALRVIARPGSSDGRRVSGVPRCDIEVVEWPSAS